MYSDPHEFEHAIPFLGPSMTASDLGQDSKIDEGFGRTVEGDSPTRKFVLRYFFARLIGWPGAVICGQLLLQTLAWGFFGTVQHRGGIALPHGLAVSAKDNPHTVEWISTQVSTILAFFSTFSAFGFTYLLPSISLFSWGMRQSITLHLRGDGMSLGAFVSYIKISSRSLILSPRKRTKLTLVAVIVFLLTGVQTAGWSALITPRSIFIETPLQGHELDFYSPLLRQMNKLDAVEYCIENSTNGPAFIVGQTESGYTAVKGDLGLPATFTVMEYSFNLSTGGILPLTLEPVNASTWFRNTSTIPSTIRPDSELPRGLDSEYSLAQQGFTADVKCNFMNNSDDIRKTLFIANTTVKDWEDTSVFPSQINFNTLYSHCLNENDQVWMNWTGAYTLANQPNYLLMIGCPSNDTSSYTIAFNASPKGIYWFMRTMICTVTPKINHVDVSYKAAFINITGATENSNSVLADIHAPPVVAAMNTLSQMTSFTQAIDTNGVGDKLKSLVSAADTSYGDSTVLRTTEEYIRGSVEYSATVFKACLASSQTFLAALPKDNKMTIYTSGTHQTETMGWTHSASYVTAIELLPGAIIALITIIVVFAAVAKHAADPKYDEYFDPSDALHLVAASANGGLDSVFVRKERRDIESAEDTMVFLGSTAARGPVLLPTRSDFSL
ncbi:hypothetical protein R3P38DRAFT_3547581 [Favolaschia claudopus]|uniref:Uncharacterized protein n=1 Tax=Favolaschia claudopus TaxID=2862362 RepID=A0AAW0E3G5_9AGAR